MKAFFKKYKHILWFSYGLLYLPWFIYLENHVTSNFHIIHMEIDDKIPFISVFIIPYMLWFAYVAVTLVYQCFTNASDFKRNCIFLFTGMTIFLIVSTIYPNGHHLRPEVYPDSSIFTQIVMWLHATDTPTNLFPSIHVYNSIGTHIAIIHSSTLKDKKFIRGTSFVLMVLICMSTVFLKQHSMFDVLTALLMSLVIYPLVYGKEVLAFAQRRRTLRVKETD